MREEKHPEVLFSENLEVHLFELPKFQLTVENLHTPLEQWLYFFKNAVRLDSEAFPANMQVPEILQAFQELIMVTQDERDWARYEERFKAEMDARSLPSILEETGRRKGRKETLVDTIRLVQQRFRQSQTPKEELEALTEAELRRQLDALLEQQVASNLHPPNGTA